MKHNAPELFREFLARDGWRPQTVTFSGVTDCYQPAERRFRLTRGCLEVALECRQPVGLITKNALVIRDLDLFQELAKRNLVHVFLSINSLDPALARAMEPRTSIPAARLRAVRTLADAGVPVGVMTAPIIPGLNDSEMPAVLHAARDAGAKRAGYVLLRLPITVEPVFREWLHRTQSSRAKMVEQRIRSTRHGRLSNSEWGERMSGHGEIAEQIGKVFDLFVHKFGLDAPMAPLDTTQFVPPLPRSGQLRLF